MNRFVSSYGSPGRWVGEEPQTWLDLALDEAMILLNDVIYVLSGASFAFLRKQFFAFEITDGTNVSRVFVDIDHPWGGDMRPVRDFVKETLGCSSATGLIQEEIKGLAGGMSLDATLRYNSSVEIHPRAFDRDVGLIDSPGVVGLLQTWATAFIQFRCILLDQ